MDRASKTGIRQLRTSAPDIDPNREIARLVSTLPPAPSAPIAGVIGISDKAAEIAKGIAETPAERRRRRQDATAKIDAEEHERISKFANKLLTQRGA